MTANGIVAAGAAKDPLILALDVGTSSVRAFVYDSQGDMIDGWGGRRTYAVTTTADGGVQIDADRLLSLLCECIDDALHAAGDGANRITAVACDTFWHSLMGVGARGQALTPVYTWADTRSAQAAESLIARLPVDQIHSSTGAVIHSSYWPAKLEWLRTTESKNIHDVTHWMSLGEYAYLHFFGERRVSVSMASATGLFDQESCTWYSPLLDAVGVNPDTLSPIAEFSDTFTGLHGSYASRWPRLNSVPWYLAVGDGAANNVGSGGCTPEWWVIMVGTSGAIRVVSETSKVVVPAGLWSYRVDKRRIIQGGALSSGGNIFAWLSHALQVPTVAELEQELAAMKPDDHGLTVLPFLAGERSPDWDANARGAFFGLTLATRPLQIVRASLEAIAYRFALIERLLRSDEPAPRGIIGSGTGLLDSPAWMQIMCDVLAQPLQASAVPEASSRGAALLVLEAQGNLDNVTSAPVPLGTKYAPVEEHTRIYSAAIDRQIDMYKKLVQ